MQHKATPITEIDCARSRLLRGRELVVCYLVAFWSGFFMLREMTNSNPR